MKELIQLAARGKRTALVLLLLGLLSGASSAGLIWLISETLERPFPEAAVSFALTALFALFTRIAFISLLNRLHQRAVFELRQDLSRRILATPLRRLEEVGAARVQATLTVDVTSLSDGFRILPSFFINLTTALGCMVYLAWLSPSLFAAALAFGVIGVFSYWMPTQRAVHVAERAREREDDLFKHIRSLTEGRKELALHRGRRDAFLSECLDPAANDLRALSVRAHDIYGATASWGLFLFFFLIGLVLFALPHLLELDARILTGYAFAILYLQQPLSVLLESLPLVNRGGVALRKIRSLGLFDAERGDANLRLPVPPFQRIELCGVRHTYHREQESDEFTLGPIDLTLRRGELLFLIGGNGSGKTTLAKLITGLYAPEGGELRLDGEPITNDNRETYRQQFSAVFSDFHLFESLLGAPADTATALRIQGYLAKLHLDRKISIRDGRFSTTDLSQGQRKRLALLAAYVEDRPIYVFDEWAADQDPIFKSVFYEQLLPDLRRHGKTVVVITHDDRYFHAADRVLRLEAGRLIAPARVSAPARRELSAGE